MEAADQVADLSGVLWRDPCELFPGTTRLPAASSCLRVSEGLPSAQMLRAGRQCEALTRSASKTACYLHPAGDERSRLAT